MKRITTLFPVLFAFCLSVSAADLQEGFVNVKEQGAHSIAAKRLPVEPSPLATQFEAFTGAVLTELTQALEYFDLKASAKMEFSLKPNEKPRVHVRIEFEDPEVETKTLESALPEADFMELPAKNLARRILGSIFSCMAQ